MGNAAITNDRSITFERKYPKNLGLLTNYLCSCCGVMGDLIILCQAQTVGPKIGLHVTLLDSTGDDSITYQVSITI